MLSTKLINLESDDGKVTPDQLRDLGHLQGNVHHVQPGIVSITQPTELGTLYTVEEITAICETAHDMGMLVHMDGARVANAAAALGASREALRAFTIEAGIDAMSFGLTKTGAIGAEAVVFFDREIETGSDYVRKQVTQLPSKMRYLSAQFNALLEDDLWLALGTHANTLARSLHAQVADPPRRGSGRRTRGQQPVSDVASRGHQAPARLELLLGLGSAAKSGAVDDGLGHHAGRR